MPAQISIAYNLAANLPKRMIELKDQTSNRKPGPARHD